MGKRLGQDSPDLLGPDFNPAPLPESANCSTWDFFSNPASYAACLNTAARAQINSVPTNAAAAYGANSPTALTAAQAAAIQVAQVPGDTANILNLYGAGQLVDNVTNPNPLGLPTWALWALGLGLVAVVLVGAAK